MLPTLRITADVAPCIATLAQLATLHALPMVDQGGDWHLHLPISGTLTLSSASGTVFTLATPTRLPRITAALGSALTQWQQRPLPLGGGWHLSTQRRACLHPHHPTIALTDKETALLTALLSASTPLSRDTLLTRIWAQEPALDTHTIETHLYRLRSKCEQLTGLTLEIRSDSEGYTLLNKP